MALKATHTSGTRQGITPGNEVASVLADLNTSRNEPQEKPLLEWKKWFDFFTVAMMVKQSIPLMVLARTNGGEGESDLMGGLCEKAASMKVICFFFRKPKLRARHHWMSYHIPEKPRKL